MRAKTATTQAMRLKATFSKLNHPRTMKVMVATRRMNVTIGGKEKLKRFLYASPAAEYAVPRRSLSEASVL